MFFFVDAIRLRNHNFYFSYLTSTVVQHVNFCFKFVQTEFIWYTTLFVKETLRQHTRSPTVKRATLIMLLQVTIPTYRNINPDLSLNLIRYGTAFYIHETINPRVRSTFCEFLKSIQCFGMNSNFCFRLNYQQKIKLIVQQFSSVIGKLIPSVLFPNILRDLNKLFCESAIRYRIKLQNKYHTIALILLFAHICINTPYLCMVFYSMKIRKILVKVTIQHWYNWYESVKE